MNEQKDSENLMDRIARDFPGLTIEARANNGQVVRLKYRDFDLFRDGDRWRASTYHQACIDLGWDVGYEDDYPPMQLDDVYPMMVNLYERAARKREEAKLKEIGDYETLAREYFALAESMTPNNRASADLAGYAYAYAADLLVKRAVLQRHVVVANCHELPWGRVPEWLDEQCGIKHDFVQRGSWKQTDRLAFLLSTLWPEDQPAGDRRTFSRSHGYGLADFPAIQRWSRWVLSRLTDPAADLWQSPLVARANLIAERALYSRNLAGWDNVQRPFLLLVRWRGGLLQPVNEVTLAATLLQDVLDAGPAFTEAALRGEVGDEVVELLVEVRGPQQGEALPRKQALREEQARLTSLSADAKRLVMADWIASLSNDRLEGEQWGRLVGRTRWLADAVAGADEVLYQKLAAAWARRRAAYA